MAVKLRENAVTKIATVTGIDATAIATTSLFVVAAGKTLVVTQVVIRCTAFTVGSKAVQVVASFGGNASTYDDYLNSVTYTIAASGVAIADTVLDAAVPVYAAAVDFRLAIETASDATAEVWAVDLLGYLV